MIALKRQSDMRSHAIAEPSRAGSATKGASAIEFPKNYNKLKNAQTLFLFFQNNTKTNKNEIKLQKENN